MYLYINTYITRLTYGTHFTKYIIMINTAQHLNNVCSNVVSKYSESKFSSTVLIERKICIRVLFDANFATNRSEVHLVTVLIIDD